MRCKHGGESATSRPGDLGQQGLCREVASEPGLEELPVSWQMRGEQRGWGPLRDNGGARRAGLPRRKVLLENGAVRSIARGLLRAPKYFIIHYFI